MEGKALQPRDRAGAKALGKQRVTEEQWKAQCLRHRSESKSGSTAGSRRGEEHHQQCAPIEPEGQSSFPSPEPCPCVLVQIQRHRGAVASGSNGNSRQVLRDSGNGAIVTNRTKIRQGP